MPHKEFDGMGREQLERLAKQSLDNLTSVQKRCTELLQEARAGKPQAMIDVAAERIRQDEKWGTIDNHLAISNGTGNRYEEKALEYKRLCQLHEEEKRVCWVDILLEEVFEAAEESDPARLRVELVQVAATAVKWVEILDLRELKQTEKQSENHDLRHCNDPGCLKGVLVGTCRRCGAVGVSTSESCPGPP